MAKKSAACVWNIFSHGKRMISNLKIVAWLHFNSKNAFYIYFIYNI